MTYRSQWYPQSDALEIKILGHHYSANNLAIAVAMAWQTRQFNRFFADVVGFWVLSMPVYQAKLFHPTISTLQNDFDQIWQPLLPGCLIAGSIAAILGLTCNRLFWRFYIARRWQLALTTTLTALRPEG